MYLARTPYLLKKIYPNAIWRLSAVDKKIYLTFDDGPVESITPWVLDVLKKYAIKATFFCVGANIEKHPAIYKRMVAEGHQTGNHTYNHLKGWNTHTKDYFKNIVWCDKILNAAPSPLLYGLSSEKRAEVKPLFRPPYGKMKKSQYKMLSKKYSIIMWDVLSGDYSKKTSNEKCLSNVMNNVRNGSIVVFHDSIKAESNLKYTLVPFIEWALEEGYIFNKIIL